MAVQHRAAYLSAAVLPQAGVGVLHCLRLDVKGQHTSRSAHQTAQEQCVMAVARRRVQRESAGPHMRPQKGVGHGQRVFAVAVRRAPHPFLGEAQRAGSSAGFPRAGGLFPCGGQCLLLWAKPAPAQQRLHRGIARRRLSTNRPRPGGAQRPAQQEGSIAPSAPFRRDRAAENFPCPKCQRTDDGPILFQYKNTRLRRGAQRIQRGSVPVAGSAHLQHSARLLFFRA